MRKKGKVRESGGVRGSTNEGFREDVKNSELKNNVAVQTSSPGKKNKGGGLDAVV